MYLVYSILLSLGFLLMLPLFLLRREKYASGFNERIGNYSEFRHDGREVIWLHCVSVGETNAARPLVDALRKEFSDYRLVVSTTTRTGQELARKIFADKADAIFYFPFDFKFSVRRALENYKPFLAILMETEIWPRFIHEAKSSGAKVVIVNGRLSQRSFVRYRQVRSFVRRVLEGVDGALMQNTPDADRMVELGLAESKVSVSGNLKFEQTPNDGKHALTEEFRSRFSISIEKPLIIAASTHDPEERYVIEALNGELGQSCRLMIAPRHPERFDSVEKLLRELPYSNVRRTAPPSQADSHADVILLDSIGELRAAYPLAEIVFVGGSLIPHGGQSVIEPAIEGKAIVTGAFTTNFDAVVKEFLKNEAIRQIPEAADDSQVSERLYEEFILLLRDKEKRAQLGRNAAATVSGSNRDALANTVAGLKRLMDEEKE